MFKESFKYYKSKCPPPDLHEIIDMDNENDDNLIPINLENLTNESFFGLIPTKTWKIYKLKNHDGLILIKNPFTSLGQRFWIARCLQDFPKYPNHVNLTEDQFSQEIIKDWWSSLIKEETKTKLKTSLRWTTLGYHHDWDTKIYDEKMKNVFPEDLGNMTEYFSRVLGFANFKSEAAIVNYYPIGTTLAGHTDHSEINLEAPLFSFSFGQTAIFLLGGKTKEEKPSAMYLKSGDVIVMSKESRLCYHAVPKIMGGCLKTWQLEDEEKAGKKIKMDFNMELVADCELESFWLPFDKYLEDSRININVRQVLNEGQIKL